MESFQDIIETQEAMPLFLWWQWGYLLIGALVLLWLSVFLWKRKKRARANALLSDLERALKQLDLLQPEQQTSNQTAIHLSLIIRQYLQNRLKDPALFETDEEFHSRSLDLQTLPANAAKPLISYLDHIAKFKYSPTEKESTHIVALVDNAKQLLPQLDYNIQPPSTP